MLLEFVYIQGLEQIHTYPDISSFPREGRVAALAAFFNTFSSGERLEQAIPFFSSMIQRARGVFIRTIFFLVKAW